MENDFTDQAVTATVDNDGRAEVSEMNPLEKEMRLQQAESNLDDAVNEETKIENELIFGQYKTMEEADKGHKALRIKLQEKHGEYVGSPEDGYSILTGADENDSQLDTENIGFQSFLKHCKDNNLSQKGFRRVHRIYE